ncbi:MAG: alanine racemase [Afipia sp.]|nr:alanine racemase [Afipia sp.]
MTPASDPKSIDTLPAGATGLLTIDLDTIVANWRKLSSQAIPADCAAVVKADAYGCGITQVSRALAKAGCRTFFVATLDEARAVREVTPTSTIYVLNGFFPGSGDQYAKFDCRPVLGDAVELAEWDAFRTTSGWEGLAAVHVDTGMNRLGFRIADAQALEARIKGGKHGFALVMSHLVNAEMLGDSVNGRQVAAFREIASLFSGVPASLANSSGIFLGSQFHFDLVRPGAALYGVNPTPEADTPMQPVVDLKARVAQVRTIEKGETVGYGGTWTARQQTRLAVISAGYADGYFRAAGGIDNLRSAEVIAAGQRCPVAGRISMDLLAIDITALPPGAIRRGGMVTLIGDGITVDELGRHFDTIGYEVLTSLGRRYVRAYKGGA